MSQRLTSLDGLRGIALVCVLAAHAGAALFGGHLIMFVLSGYVITAALVREHERTGTIDARGFSVRRVVRLLPALCGLLVVLNIITPFLRPDMASQLTLDSFASLMFVSNWTQVIAPHDSLLMHLWSLSVQEQVYVVWPLVMRALCRSRRGLMWACVVGAVGVYGLRVIVVLSGAPLSIVYFMTFTRIDGILLGSAMALAPGPRLSPSIARFLSVACVLFLGACLCAYSLLHPLAYIITMPIASVCTAMLIALCLHGQTFVSRALSHPALVHLGTISYGVYLWHYPLIVLLIGITPAYGVIGVVCGLVAGEVSYRLIERPCIGRKTRPDLKRV
jgi:peptidoglycan/LPS O-acetylase OafA/YrhL